MFKFIPDRTTWIANPTVAVPFSMSNHFAKDFADYVPHWMHNGHWLFNSAAPMLEIAHRENVSIADVVLFYYEAYELQYDEPSRTWCAFHPDASFLTDVQEPARKRLRGFDVVTYSFGNGPECSPLACNGLADTLPVNEHCLMTSLEEAKIALEAGLFDNSEPGPFRIVAVHTVE